MENYGSSWFDMGYGTGSESFEVEFEYNAWEDCYDPRDWRSYFWEWEYNITKLYYLTEHGDEVVVDLDNLTNEQMVEVDRAVEGEIESLVL